MNPNVSALYAAIHNNKIEAIESNLQAFVDLITKLHPENRNYMWYNRAFKKESYFSITLDGKEYWMQKAL